MLINQQRELSSYHKSEQNINGILGRSRLVLGNTCSVVDFYPG